MAGRLSLPSLQRRALLAGAVWADAMPVVWSPDVGDRGHDFPRHAQTVGGLAPGHVLVVEPENGASALGWRGCWGWAATRRRGRGCTTSGERWYGRAVID